MIYAELEELFSKLSDRDRFRLVCRYVLKLPTDRISRIESCSHEAVYQSFRRAEIKLKDMNTKTDLLASYLELLRF